MRKRLGALALGVLLLAAYSSTWAHLVLVRHATCSDHGELIHADELSKPAAASDASEPGYSDPASVASNHAHHHCTASFIRRAATTWRCMSRGVAVPQANEPSAPIDWADALAAPRALLRLAPKSSPPVAG